MQRLEVSGAVRPIYMSLGVKRLRHRHYSNLYITVDHKNVIISSNTVGAAECNKIVVFGGEISLTVNTSKRNGMNCIKRHKRVVLQAFHF